MEVVKLYFNVRSDRSELYAADDCQTCINITKLIHISLYTSQFDWYVSIMNIMNMKEQKQQQNIIQIL